MRRLLRKARDRSLLRARRLLREARDRWRPWRSFLRRLGRWFLRQVRDVPEWRSLGTWVLGLGVTFALGLLMADGLTERVQVSGVWLEILGVGAVGVGLRHLRRQFNRTSWWERLREGLSTFPKLRPEGIAVSVGPATATASAGGVGVLKTGEPEKTLPERVEALEREIERVDEQVQRLRTDLATETRERKAGDEREARRRRERDEALEEQIESLAVGGIRWEVLGIWWVIPGVVMAGVPEMVASLVPETVASLLAALIA